MLILRRRQGSAAAVSIAGILGSVFLAQAPLLPRLNTGAWGATHPSAAAAVTASAVFFTIELVRVSISRMMRAPEADEREQRSHVGPWRPLLAVLSVWAAAGLLFPQLTISWGPNEVVESYLRDQTPLGSTYEDVVGWLAARGTAPNRGPFPTDTATIMANNAAAISAIVDRYASIPFETVVEALYTFDGP
jgi:hypothetical protein